MDLFNECLERVKSCIIDAKMDKSSIHDVVLVGGSSRIPKVQQLLQEFFEGKELCQSINPDEAVAYGAAVQAAMLCDSFKNVPNLVLQDVAPLSLGIGTKGDIMSVVIPRNSSIPVKKTKVYATSKDNNRAGSINVYEGERAKASDNNLLGSFIISFRPGARRGTPVEVCFTIDENGILTVSAMEKSTGNTNKITITNDKERLSRDKIKKLIEEAREYHAEDEKFLKKAKVMNNLDDCIYKLRNALKNEEVKSSQKVKHINLAITEATNLLDKNKDKNELNVLEYHLKELKNMLEDLEVKSG
jgi:L1 cell adhesion molecule like protein